MTLEITKWDTSNWNGPEDFHTFELEDLLPDHKAEFYERFSEWLTYDMWCRNPKLSITTTLYTDHRLNPQITFLPGLGKEPWAMIRLAKNEDIRDKLHLETWLNS